MRRCVVALAVCGALAGCVANPPADGASVALVREAMAEAGRVAETPATRKPAVDAVRKWRSTGAAN